MKQQEQTECHPLSFNRRFEGRHQQSKGRRTIKTLRPSKWSRRQKIRSRHIRRKKTETKVKKESKHNSAFNTKIDHVKEIILDAHERSKEIEEDFCLAKENTKSKIEAQTK